MWYSKTTCSYLASSKPYCFTTKKSFMKSLCVCVCALAFCANKSINIFVFSSILRKKYQVLQYTVLYPEFHAARKSQLNARSLCLIIPNQEGKFVLFFWFS